MISSIPKWIGNLFEGTLSPNVRVTETSYLSREIKRIRFQGDISKMNIQIGYANVIRVSDTEFRNYTISYYDNDREIFDVVVHIHGNGVGSKYIDGLALDDKTYISPARGKKLYEPGVKKQVIFGDETSLGFACSILPSLKQLKHDYHFYLELHEENQNVPKLLGLDQFTVFPKNGSTITEGLIYSLPIFKTDNWQESNFILTGNVASIKTFRKVLKERNAGRILSKGYWLEGKNGL